MKLSGLIDALVAAGCTIEQVQAFVRAAEADEEEKRAAKRAGDAERQRKSRASRLSQMSRVTERDVRDPPKRKVSPNPSKENNPQKPLPTHPSDARVSPEGIEQPNSARGSRINPQWTPDLEDLDCAKAEGLDDLAIRREAERFRDHWLSKPGADGRKVDWHATWRNWIRKAADQRPGGQANGARAGPLRPERRNPTFAAGEEILAEMRSDPWDR